MTAPQTPAGVESRARRAARSLGAGAAGAACWLAASAFAVGLHVANHPPGRPFRGGLDGYEELLGFAPAFLTSGALSGVAVLGALGGRRRAVVMGVLLACALGPAVGLAVWGYPRLAVRGYGYSPLSAAHFQKKLVEHLEAGAALGVVSGLAVAAPAVVGRGLLGPWASGRLRLALVPVLIGMTVYALPPFSAGLVGVGRWLGWGYGGHDAEALIGASAGSVTGAGGGIVVALLVARALGGRRRSPRD